MKGETGATGPAGPEAKLGIESVLTENLKKESVTGEKIAPALKKVIPLAVGRSAEMTLGKITIASAGVTATGPILVSSEGAGAVGVTVTARKVGESFTVEASSPVSTARVNWAIYSE